jgi:hypothetical protein
MPAEEPREPEPTPEEKRFVEGLLERGEAAEPDEDGKLPPGATHEIVERRDDGSVRVKRRRFSIS